MPVRPLPTLGNTTIANTRAEILLSLGSYAAMEALAHCATAHVRRAEMEADKELAEHWEKVRDIFEKAKREIGALT